MAVISRHAFGSKANIETAKTEGIIDAYDVLFLDTKEIGWIAKDGSTVMATPRTQESIVVNGVTGLGISNGATIAAGTSLDEFVKMVVQKAIPATYNKPAVSIANNGGQYYFVVETGVMWTYQNGWVQITTTPSDVKNYADSVASTAASDAQAYADEIGKRVTGSIDDDGTVILTFGEQMFTTE